MSRISTALLVGWIMWSAAGWAWFAARAYYANRDRPLNMSPGEWAIWLTFSFAFSLIVGPTIWALDPKGEPS